MKTLEEIKLDIGEPMFAALLKNAESNLRQTPYKHKEPNAQQAFIHEEMIRQYSILRGQLWYDKGKRNNGNHTPV